MKNLILGIGLIFAISCDTEGYKTQLAMTDLQTPVTKSSKDSTFILGPEIPSQPYELKLNLNPLGENIYELEILMELYNGAHFVSPNAQRDFSGKFTVLMDETTLLERQGPLIESPLSKEEFDPHPFTNGLVNWVRVNTSYTQKVQLLTPTDFQVQGIIQFTIEPRCTLEKIPFILKKVKGVLKFEIFQC